MPSPTSSRADAMASLANLLELLAPIDRRSSELVEGLPHSTLVHERLPHPWGMKGTVMRVLHERLDGRDVDTTDGIKVFDERGWAQVLPDPDEPVVHVYAEGRMEEDSGSLLSRSSAAWSRRSSSSRRRSRRLELSR